MESEIAYLAYQKNKKSVLIAYLLLIFLGGLGLHRFYASSTGVGFIMLLSTLVSLAAPPAFLITVIFMIIDIFLIPSLVHKKNLETAVSYGITNKNLI